MRATLLLFLLIAVPLSACARAAAPIVSPPVIAGGLACFTVTPSATPPKNGKLYPSCDRLCTDQGAVCSGVTSTISPPLTCAAPAGLATCRCCSVAK